MNCSSTEKQMLCQLYKGIPKNFPNFRKCCWAVVFMSAAPALTSRSNYGKKSVGRLINIQRKGTMSCGKKSRFHFCQLIAKTSQDFLDIELIELSVEWDYVFNRCIEDRDSIFLILRSLCHHPCYIWKNLLHQLFKEPMSLSKSSLWMSTQWCTVSTRMSSSMVTSSNHQLRGNSDWYSLLLVSIYNLTLLPLSLSFPCLIHLPSVALLWLMDVHFSL